MPAQHRPPVKGTSLLFDVFVLVQAVGDLLGTALRGTPLTAEEYAVYSHLLEVEPCSPTQLARDLRVPPTTVSDWVRTMTARGHAARTRSAADRRSYELALTAAGRRAHRATNRVFEAVNAAFVAELMQPEGELRGHLAEIIRAAGAVRPGRSG